MPSLSSPTASLPRRLAARLLYIITVWVLSSIFASTAHSGKFVLRDDYNLLRPDQVDELTKLIKSRERDLYVRVAKGPPVVEEEPLWDEVYIDIGDGFCYSLRRSYCTAAAYALRQGNVYAAIVDITSIMARSSPQVNVRWELAIPAAIVLWWIFRVVLGEKARLKRQARLQKVPVPVAAAQTARKMSGELRKASRELMSTIGRPRPTDDEKEK